MVFTTNLFTPKGSSINVSDAANAQNADVGIYRNADGNPVQVVVWIEDNTVFSQRFDANGNPTSATPITVGTDAGEGAAPKVAVTPDGQIYVAYARGVVEKTITVTATVTDPEDDVTGTATVTATDVELVEGTDNVVVKKIIGDTVEANFDDDGVLEVEPNTDSALQRTPDIAAFNDGSFAVVWSEEVTKTVENIDTVTGTQTGTVSVTVTVTGTCSETMCFTFPVATLTCSGPVCGPVTLTQTVIGTGTVTGTQTAIVTGTALDSDVYLRKYEADGDQLTDDAVEVAATDDASEIDPAIAARPGADPGLGNTALSVTWTEQRDRDREGEFSTLDDIGFARFDRQDNPNRLGTGIFAISGNQGDTSVDLSGDGTSVATWTVADVRISSGVSVGGDINYIQVGPGGQLLNAGSVAATEANETNSSVASALNGEFTIAYQSGDETFIQTYTADGQPKGDPKLVEGVGPNPAIAVLKDGSAQDFAALAGENGSVNSQLLAQKLTGPDFNISLAGDLPDPDRQADIVWRNVRTGVNSVWLIDPENLQRIEPSDQGNLLLRSESNTDWEIVGVGDWTNGGVNDDLLWRNEVLGETSVWDQDGVIYNRSVELSDQETNPAWKIRAVGDIDRDAVQDDIFWQNTVTGEVSAWVMDGPVRTDNVAIRTERNTNWELVGAGDFVGDSRDELVFYNIGLDDPNRGVISIWILNEDGTFANSQVFNRREQNVGTPQARGWRIMGVADMNGDGQDDLVWRNFSNPQGANSYWLINPENPLDVLSGGIVSFNTEVNPDWVSIV